MAATLDRLAAVGFDATSSVVVWFCLWLPVLVMISQPARRRFVAMVAGLGSLVIPAGMILDLIPTTSSVGVHRDLVPPGISFVIPAIGNAKAIRHALVVAYGVGLAAQGGRWLLGSWGVVRLIRDSSAPSTGTASLYTWLTRDLGRPPTLRVSARLRKPALFGTIRPTILIPNALDRAAHRDALRLTLLHELAHFQRRDPFARLVSELTRTVWFFLPPAWWFAAQLRLDQEFLADRDAAESFGSRERYAALLFERAGAPADRSRSERTLGSAWIGGPALYQRLRMLLQCPFVVERQPPVWFRTLAAGLGVSVGLGLSGISWSDAGPNEVLPTSGTPHFTLHRFRTGPQAVPRPERLPLPIGAEFELSAEFVADTRADLQGARLAGYQLPEFDSESPEGRYPVHLSRRGNQARWRLGDRELPAGPSDDPESAWLTVTAPPNRVVEIRDLVLKTADSSDPSDPRQGPIPSPLSRSSFP